MNNDQKKEQLIFIFRNSSDYIYLLYFIYSSNYKVKITYQVYEAINWAKIMQEENKSHDVILADDDFTNEILAIEPGYLNDLNIFTFNKDMEIKDINKTCICDLYSLFSDDNYFSVLLNHKNPEPGSC